MNETDFLDITLNLSSGKFWPNQKPNNQPLYIHAASNHPPIIKTHLPSMIGKRVSEISYNQEEVKKAIPLNNEALKNSGYSSCLTFQQEQPKRNSRARKRKVAWFNHHTATASKPTLARSFLGFSHSPSHHKLRKICNNNCVKLSYSCMPNVAAITSSHNKELLREKTAESDPLPYNCRDKSNCFLNGRCREKSLVYKATVHVNNNNAVMYYGLCKTEFKSRYYNHLQSFKQQHKASATELSKHIWRCKDAGLNPTVSWEIVRHAPAYNSGNRVCQLYF